MLNLVMGQDSFIALNLVWLKKMAEASRPGPVEYFLYLFDRVWQT